MVQVLTWPTTVLETGPVCAMMKNWEMLMSAAKQPDYFEWDSSQLPLYQNRLTLV